MNDKDNELMSCLTDVIKDFAKNMKNTLNEKKNETPEKREISEEEKRKLRNRNKRRRKKAK